MLLDDAEQPTPTLDGQRPSPDCEAFEHDGIVVYPAAVLFDRVRDRLIVVVRAISKDPSSPTTIDVLLGRISAFVIAGNFEYQLSRTSIELYLRYPGDIDVAIDANRSETAQQVEDRRDYLRHRGLTNNHQEQQLIPAQVLAYVLDTSSRHAGERNPHPVSAQTQSILTDGNGSRRNIS